MISKVKRNAKYQMFCNLIQFEMYLSLGRGVSVTNNYPLIKWKIKKLKTNTQLWSIQFTFRYAQSPHSVFLVQSVEWVKTEKEKFTSTKLCHLKTIFLRRNPPGPPDFLFSSPFSCPSDSSPTSTATWPAEVQKRKFAMIGRTWK